MIAEPKPHIPDLRFRLCTAFTYAKDFYDTKALTADDSSILVKAREFRAALLLLDTLVVHDRFTSLRALNDCCWALFA
jgi:hypothetical protein